MMRIKKRSKTLWFNILTVALTAIALPEVTGLLPEEGLRFVVAFQAVGNLVLRFWTTGSVMIKAPDARSEAP